MKRLLLYLGLTSIFLVLVAGCSSGMNGEDKKIIVQERVEDRYELFQTIEKSEDVKEINDIITDAKWQNGVVDMAYPPHYKFDFVAVDADEETATDLKYQLWISPNKDKVMLTNEEEDQFVQLNEGTSAELFQLLTGKELGEGHTE